MLQVDLDRMFRCLPQPAADSDKNDAGLRAALTAAERRREEAKSFNFMRHAGSRIGTTYCVQNNDCSDPIGTSLTASLKRWRCKGRTLR
jgi:hypothetical protein